MKKKPNLKNVIPIIVFALFASLLAVWGYRIIVTAGEVPGKLGSVSAAAYNLNDLGKVSGSFKKISYETMRYGYMDDLMLARMDSMDRFYESERMEEIRTVNNLTAMMEKTSDKLAYAQAKVEQEESAKRAKAAAEAAEAAKKAKIQAIADRIANGYNNTSETEEGSTTADSSDTASRGGKKGEPVYASKTGKSLGKYVITAYCTCRICCGIYSGNNRTASGTVPTSNRTIAVDTSVIPFGTKVVINGQVYVAEDRGGAIKGKRIDMFFMTHKEALRWGRKTIEVYLAE